MSRRKIQPALSGRSAWPETAQQLPEPSRCVQFGEPHGRHVFFVRPRSRSFLRPVAAELSARRRHWGLGRAPASALNVHTNAMLAPAPPSAALAFAPLRGALFSSGMVIAILGGHCPFPRKKRNHLSGVGCRQRHFSLARSVGIPSNERALFSGINAAYLA